MAFFLPPTIGLDVWLLLEPRDATGTDTTPAPEGDAGTGEEPLPAGENAACNGLPPPESGSASEWLFGDYRVVAKYGWHLDDNAFATPWHSLVQSEIEDRDHERDPPNRRRGHPPTPEAEPGSGSET